MQRGKSAFPNRRSFLRAAAASGAALGVFSSASGQIAKNFERGHDILITGGVVYDGSGGPGFEADVAVKGDRITAVERGLRPEAVRVIDARGCAVAPGFIDPHTHTDSQLIDNPRAESAVRQGVTTEIAGNCGSSPFLRSARSAAADLHHMFSRLESGGIAINYATLVGHSAIRTYAMGTNDRPPTAAQMLLMKRLVRESMEGGAAGLSSGLYYAPGCFASKDEIIELCREIVPFDGVYATHMRDEGDSLLESIDEAIAIAERSGARLQVSHLKTMYPRNHGKAAAALSAIESAQRGGLRVLADRYPYIASATSLDVFFPREIQQGSTKEFLARLGDPALENGLREHMNRIGEKIVSWDTIMICGVGDSAYRKLEGKTVLAASREAGKPPFEFIRDLLLATHNRVDIINFAMSEDNLRVILAHPLTVIGSDGLALAPYGKLRGGNPHPRHYGTFPRVLGKYVREEKVLPLPAAIRKMTSMSADQFGLRQRGRVREGDYADLVVFDPSTVTDRADWLNPRLYPDGIEYVLVNGKVVIERGEHTGALPGKCLRNGRG
jgi:N-acyl-D-amino-acid deacylase